MLAQGFAIFFSVVIAFAVDRLGEQEREAVLRETALRQFLTEIRANRGYVAERLPYHTGRMEGFAALMQGPLPATFDEAAEQAGFQGPRWVGFSDVAWRTAQGTDVLPLLPYDLAGTLTQTYAIQEEVMRIQRDFTAVAIDPASYAGGNVSGGIRAATTYFAIVVELENTLLNYQYGRAEAAVAEALGEEISPDSTAPPAVPPPDTTR
ncbi:MAG TPA: hypothetical protein VK610_02275 [Rhodothermales bacterium]|nr:hypothetical protein [Rhodothermales bacterium]